MRWSTMILLIAVTASICVLGLRMIACVEVIKLGGG